MVIIHAHKSQLIVTNHGQKAWSQIIVATFLIRGTGTGIGTGIGIGIGTGTIIVTVTVTSTHIPKQ